MTLQGDFAYPTAFRIGAGRVAELPAALREAGIARTLVVVDAGIIDGPAFAPVAAALEKTPHAIFSKVNPDPTLACAQAGAAAYREFGADGVLAVGGGSALDAGKAAAFLLHQTRPIWDFEDIGDKWRGANADIPPIVAVPTTAGTGSEVGRAVVISGPNGKKIIFHPKMMPAIALADPELTRGLPPHLTAATGFDALAHALEALCAPTFHPPCEGIALEALRLIRDGLPRAFANGGDMDARASMMAAAMMGATAFQKGLGAVHSLSHPLGFLFKTHHGLLNAILLPYVVARNCQADSSGGTAEKLSRLARLLDLTPPDPDGVLRWLLDLRRDLKIPHSLSDAGIGKAAADSHHGEIVRMAARDPTAATNPVPLDEAECEKILAAALAGEV